LFSQQAVGRNCKQTVGPFHAAWELRSLSFFGAASPDTSSITGNAHFCDY
jgi:hypothetical protein